VTSDPVAIARTARLRYAPDDRPGIVRRRRGSGFSYAGPRGGTVSAADRERIRSLVIPPAWRDVWIAPEPDAHLQATGIDDAGRKQYLYHARWRDVADAEKFRRLADFAPALVRIRKRVAHDLRNGSDDLLCATAARLIDRSLIRPGGRGNDSPASGATDLGGSHVTVARGRVVLDFVGKSGVDQHVEVHDRELARVLSQILDGADDDTPLFRSGDDVVDERRLNAYLGDASRASYTAKDFRTWGATATVVAELALADPGVGSVGESERAAIAAAADALGNTVAVCRSSYVAPAALAAFQSGELAQHWRASRRGKWLSRAERTTARVLDDAR
jgi:DNA topoisomerase-1